MKDLCPKCGKHAVETGYGLAGGGIGVYRYCEECDFFEKFQDPEYAEDVEAIAPPQPLSQDMNHDDER